MRTENTLVIGMNSRIASIFKYFSNSIYLLVKKTPKPTDLILDEVAEFQNIKEKAFNKPTITIKKIFIVRNIVKEKQIIIYSYFAQKGLKIPFVVSERSNPKKYNFVKKILLKKIFKNADATVFQTPDVQKWYRLSKSTSSKVIFNPITISSFCEKKENSKKIAFVGSFQKAKNFPLLLDSFALFHQRHREFILMIFGVERENESLKNLIKKRNLTSCVIVSGKDSEWYKKENFSAYLSCSFYEGMSNSVLEAVSNGFPCVVTDCPVGANKIICRYYENVFLSSLKKDDFAKKIDLAVNATRKAPVVHSNFTLKNVSCSWFELLEFAIRGK